MSKFLGLIPYTGNKQKLLETIHPLFPDHDRFVDAFCGGLSVTLSAPGKVLANDYDHTLIAMYNAIQRDPDPVETINNIIREHGLTRSDSEAYYRFRDLYNQCKNPMWLYVLIQHSFSNVNRTNEDWEFNATFGRRTFNHNSLKRLDHFKERTASGNIEFSSMHYSKLDVNSGDFIYADPPYLITDACYNRFWSEKEEVTFLQWLHDLDKRGIRWGLSNVTHHKGKVNQFLVEFIEKYGYNVLPLNKRYVLDRGVDSEHETREVYVTNYPLAKQPVADLQAFM